MRESVCALRVGVSHLRSVHGGQKRVLGPWNWSCQPPRGCCELDPGPLLELQLFFSDDPSLQPTNIIIFEQSQFRSSFCLTHPARVDGIGAVGHFGGESVMGNSTHLAQCSGPQTF